MTAKIRFRTLFIAIACALASFMMFIAGPVDPLIKIPNGLAPTVIFITDNLRFIFLAAAAFYTRKAFTDYPEADFQSLLSVAKTESYGAGMAAIAVALIFLALCLLIGMVALATAISGGGMAGVPAV